MVLGQDSGADFSTDAYADVAPGDYTPVLDMPVPQPAYPAPTSPAPQTGGFDWTGLFGTAQKIYKQATAAPGTPPYVAPQSPTLPAQQVAIPPLALYALGALILFKFIL